jgi:hypothetical protein
MLWTYKSLFISELDPMTPEEQAWRLLLARLSVKGVLPVTFSLARIVDGSGWALRATMTTRAVKDTTIYGDLLKTDYPLAKGTEIPVGIVFAIPERLHEEGEQAMLTWVLKRTAPLYLHELCEQFFMDDRQPFDPHAEATAKILVRGFFNDE